MDVGAGQVPQLGEHGGLPIQNQIHVTSSHMTFLQIWPRHQPRACQKKLGARACTQPQPQPQLGASLPVRLARRCLAPVPPTPRWSQAQTCGPANDRKDGTGLAAATAVKPAAAANAGQTAFCAARRRHHPPAAALEPSPKPTAPATRKCLFCDCLRTPLRGHACGDRGRDCRAR